MPKAAASLGITDKLLYNWKAKFEAEQAELKRLRKENKELRMEKEILEKASALLLKETKSPLKALSCCHRHFQ